MGQTGPLTPTLANPSVLTNGFRQEGHTFSVPLRGWSQRGHVLAVGSVTEDSHKVFSAVNFPAIADFENHDGFFIVINGKNDPPILLPDTVLLAAFHFFTTMGTGLLGKVLYLIDYASQVFGAYNPKFFFGGFFEEYFIGFRHA